MSTIQCGGITSLNRDHAMQKPELRYFTFQPTAATVETPKANPVSRVTLRKEIAEEVSSENHVAWLISISQRTERA